jgi:hypothetical protein
MWIGTRFLPYSKLTHLSDPCFFVLMSEMLEQERDCRTIFVGNIPASPPQHRVKRALLQMFSPFGTIQSLRFRSLASASTKLAKGKGKALRRYAFSITPPVAIRYNQKHNIVLYFDGPKILIDPSRHRHALVQDERVHCVPERDRSSSRSTESERCEAHCHIQSQTPREYIRLERRGAL